MDEAFSALDPLIRSQMQDELLDLQAKMHKTIVFITHDLDEALKIGDRIAILGPGGKVRQIGTPEEILSEPADDYVRKFVQSIDRTKVITASSIQQSRTPLAIEKDGTESALHLMEKQSASYAFVVNKDRKLLGFVVIDDVIKLKKDKKHELNDILREDVYTTSPQTAVSDLLAAALETPYPIAVIDGDNRFLGIVDRAAIIAEVEEGLEDSETPSVLSEVK
jgi:glycine betaine/proline transport system ATP-binding protein